MAKRTGKYPHIIVDATKVPNVLRCEHCGEEHKLALPMLVQLVIAKGRAFEKLHKDCPKPEPT